MVVLKPNIVRGGRAIGLGNNFYLMKGRTHSEGGIDIGKNPETGLEVERDEVVQVLGGTNSVSPKGIRVFSAQPILGGISPAQYILEGANPNQVFNAQEQWKKVNRINDDGTKFEKGGKKRGKIAYGTPTDARLRYLDYDKKLVAYINHIAKQYGISPALLANRLSNEGIIDYAIKRADRNLDKDLESILDEKGGENIRNGFRYYGLDDAYSLFEQGKLNLRRKIPFTKYIDWNELGRKIESVEAQDPYDVIELVAANLEYFGKELKKNFPNLNERELNNAISQAYNAGIYGAINDIKKNGINKKYNIDDRYYNINYNNDLYLNNKNNKNLLNTFTVEDQYNELNKLEENYRETVLKQDNRKNKLVPPTGVVGELSKKYAIDVYKNGQKHGEWGKGFNGMASHPYKIGTDFTYNNPFFNVPFSFKYGGIHIKPSKRGTFTAAAKKHGMSVQGFSSKVLANKGKYSPAMVKKANFARNASKWKHKEFGGDMDFNYWITKDNIYKLGGRKKGAIGLYDIPYATEEQVKKLITDEIGLGISNKSQRIVNNALSNNSRLLEPPLQNTIDRNNALRSIASNQPAIKINNPLDIGTIGNIIGTGINIAGNLISYGINNRALNRMRRPSMPLPLRAENLQTRVSTAAQEAAIRENVAGQEELISGNLASSRSRLNAINRVRNQGTSMYNQLQDRKQNIETELINRNKLNRQQIGNQNVLQFNNWRNISNEFDNKIIDLGSENGVNLIQGISDATAGEKGYIENIENNARYRMNAFLTTIANPDAFKAMNSTEIKRLARQFGITNRQLRDLGINV